MITVYTTETCASCAMVKRYLSTKNVEYNTVDITNDDKKRSELYAKTGMSRVPVITNGQDYVVGFIPGDLAKLLS